MKTADLFEHAADFDPDAGVEGIAGDVPAAWCVYAMFDRNAAPVQLLCVKNLRASLRRRLGEPDDPSPRRLDLKAIVRRVAWTRVDSPFEQDWAYLETARSLFPDSYGGVLGFHPAWFVHCNPATKFPRLTRQNKLDKRTGLYLGPLPDKHAADRYVRAIEDAFDLCRDWDRLTGAKSDPCQWREMGKCVGPCEGPPGGVSLDAYRALVAHAVDVIRDVPRALQDLNLRMRHAAAEQQFEKAAEIKSHVDSLSELNAGHNRHARPVEDFRYLAVMPGGREAAAKLFAVTPGRVAFVAALLEVPTPASVEPVLRTALSLLADDDDARPTDAAAFERISLVAAHLFAPKNRPGEFVPARDLDPKRLAAACRAAAKSKSDDADDEGEVRGLQAV